MTSAPDDRGDREDRSAFIEVHLATRPEWVAPATAVLHQLCTSLASFTIADLWALLPDTGERRAIGAAMAQGIRHGWLAKRRDPAGKDIYRNLAETLTADGQPVHHHTGRVPIYDSLLYEADRPTSDIGASITWPSTGTTNPHRRRRLASSPANPRSPRTPIGEPTADRMGRTNSEESDTPWDSHDAERQEADQTPVGEPSPPACRTCDPRRTARNAVVDLLIALKYFSEDAGLSWPELVHAAATHYPSEEPKPTPGATCAQIPQPGMRGPGPSWWALPDTDDPNQP